MAIQILSWIAVALGVALDTSTILRAFHRNKAGHGASGLPVIPWVLYCVGTVLMSTAVVTKIFVFLGLTTFHVMSQWLLPEVHRTWFNGRSPLHRAVWSGHINTAQMLLRSGTDANVMDNAGETPLHIAVIRGNRKMVELLLTHGARAEIKNRNGVSALQIATACQRNDLLELLEQYQR